MSSRDRAVVITGAGTGIGRAAARAFAGDGANVLIVGRTAATLEETAGDDPRIRPLVADISAPGAPEKIVATALDAFGRIDVLVNNAAFIKKSRLHRLNRAETEEQLATNLLAPVYLTECALEALTATRGTVINISTAMVTGQRAWLDSAIYGAAKAGLDYLTRTWALELGRRGIRVVGLAPGLIETGVHERIGYTEEQHRAFAADIVGRIPAGRVGQPEEIARWIVHLAGPDAGYVTGVVLTVDGGFSIA